MKINTQKYKFISSIIIILTTYSCGKGNQQSYNPVPLKKEQVYKYREFKLNENISPCTDFYEHVCSNEVSKFTLPKDKLRYVFSFHDPTEIINEQRILTFNSIKEKKSLNNNENMLISFYNSCMNISSRYQEEKQTIENYKDKVNSMNKDDIFRLFAQQTLNGEKSLFSLTTNYDFKNPLITNLSLNYYPILQKAKLYENKDALKDYKNLINDFLNLLNINKNNTLEFIYNFEKNSSKEATNDFENFQKNLKTIDIESYLKYIDNTFKSLQFNVILKNFKSDVKIEFYNENAIPYILNVLSIASIEQLQALALWNQFSFDFIEYTDKNYYQKEIDFRKKYLFEDKFNLESIEENCFTEITKSDLLKNLDYEVHEKYYKSFSAEKVRNIVKKIQESTYESIKNTWLTNKNKALIKIKNMSFQIVRPKSENHWNIVKNIDFDENSFRENQFKIKKYFHSEKLELKQRNLERWEISPLEVNAIYESRKNQFTLPLGILKPPFYDENRSEHLNLAAIGMVIGHEIGHSIDNNGANYDKNGILNSILNIEDEKSFTEKGNKIKNLFEEHEGNAKLTLNEDIADFVGIQNAYKAAFPQNASHSIQNKKEFFIQYARNWCGISTKEAIDFLKLADYHSPLKLRVNVQMIMNKNFKETFSCKESDPMGLSKDKQVEIW